VNAWACSDEDVPGFRRTDSLIRSSVAKAFSEAGLDSENDDDWPLVTLYLALSVFGPRGRGAPKKWTPLKRLQLFNEFLKRVEQNPKSYDRLQVFKQIAATGMFNVRGNSDPRRGIETTPAKALEKAGRALEKQLKLVARRGKF
jgi:hypothetical protein